MSFLIARLKSLTSLHTCDLSILTVKNKWLRFQAVSASPLRPREEAGTQWLLARILPTPLFRMFLAGKGKSARPCLRDATAYKTEGEAWRMVAHWREAFLTFTKVEGWLTCAQARCARPLSCMISFWYKKPVCFNFNLSCLLNYFVICFDTN